VALWDLDPRSTVLPVTTAAHKNEKATENTFLKYKKHASFYSLNVPHAKFH